MRSRLNTALRTWGVLAALLAASVVYGQSPFTQSTKNLLMYNGAAAGSDKYVSLSVNAGLSANYQLLYPNPAPAVNQMLQVTSISGTDYTMSWVNGVTGTGTATQVAYWNSTNSISGNNNLWWDNTNGRLGIATNTPAQPLEVKGNTLLSQSGGVASQLQLQNPAGTFVSSFAAGAQGATFNYTLPTTIPSANQVLTATSVAAPAVTLGWVTPAAGSNWTLTGNGGTTPGTNFIGTTDAGVAWIVKTANVQRERFAAADSIRWGINGTGATAPPSTFTIGAAGYTGASSSNSQPGTDLIIQSGSGTGNDTTRAGIVMQVPNQAGANTTVQTPTSRFRMRSGDGFVSLGGVHTPNAPLHVRNSNSGHAVVNLENTATDGFTSIDFINDLATVGNVGVSNSAAVAFPGQFYFNVSSGATIPITFNQQTAEKMAVDLNGDVYVVNKEGIGFTSVTYNSIAYALDVRGSAAGTLDLARLQNNQAAAANNGSELLFAANRTTGGLTNIAAVSGLITDITNGAYKGALVFSTANNAAPAERMRIDNAGNVGIATTIPGQPLEVKGNTLLSQTGGVASQLQLQNPAATFVSTFAAGAQGATFNYTLPTTIPTANQVLTASAVAAPAVTLSWTTVAGAGTNWSTTGNGGTTPGTNFIGTTDAGVAWIVKTANVQRERFAAADSIRWGINGNSTTAPPNSFVVGAAGFTSVSTTLGNDQAGTDLIVQSGPGTGQNATRGAIIFQVPSIIGGAGATTVQTPTEAMRIGAVGTALIAAQTGMTITDGSTSTTGSLAKTGLIISSTGAWTGASSTNTGIVVTATGGTLNYAGTFNTNVGIGNTAPAGLLDVSGALTAANSAIGKYLSLSASTFTNSSAAGTYASEPLNSIAQPTLAATNAVTTTNAYTLNIAGAPVKGANQTVTNTTALNIAAGAVSTAVTSYGLQVNAQTGATGNNYTAAFLGGNVGIGNSAPAGLLDVSGALTAANSAIGKYISLSASTFTNSSAAGTYATEPLNSIAQPTLAATNAVTTTNAYTLNIAGAPIKGANQTVTNTTALNIAAGAVSTAVTSYGLQVNAQTGATGNNYAAAFSGGNVGIGTKAPTHVLHSVYTGTNDEVAAVFGNATGNTNNLQSIGVWGSASGTSDATHKGEIGVLAIGNGNTTAGQTNVALQLNDGEFTMGRTTQTGTNYSVINPATAGVSYHAEGPSGVIEIDLSNLTFTGNVQNSRTRVATITLNNRYISTSSIVLMDVVEKVSSGSNPSPLNTHFALNGETRSSGSIVIEIWEMLDGTALGSGTAWSGGDLIRVGYTVINPGR